MWLGAPQTTGSGFAVLAGQPFFMIPKAYPPKKGVQAFAIMRAAARRGAVVG